MGRTGLSVAVASLLGMSERSDPAADRRAAERAGRVSAGLEELDQWLCDQIRVGLAELERTGHSRLEQVAARMVDAQAPGVARRLRRLGAVLLSGEGRHARLLEQFALLRLLVLAHRRLPELPAPLEAAVRARVGYPISRAKVLEGPGIRDTWAVVGQRDSIEEQLTARRVWLRGTGSGRWAIELTYAPPGQRPESSLETGTSLEADLHFYPSGLRALVGARHEEAGPLPRLEAGDVEAALAGHAAALGADPWLPGWPVLLGAVTPVRAGDRWSVREESGLALPLADSAGEPWRLVAVSGGQPVTLAAEWGPEGLTPLSVIRGQELVEL